MGIMWKTVISDGPKVKKYGHIILTSRINDLLIGKDIGLFHEYYVEEKTYAPQIIVDTRNYYTHNDKEKEARALKGDELL